MELKKYYKPTVIITLGGAILSKIFGFDLLFFPLLIIGFGLVAGSYDNKEGKSGFFYLGLFGLMCILTLSLFLACFYIFKVLGLLPG